MFMPFPIAAMPNDVEGDLYPEIKIPTESQETAEKLMPKDKRVIGLHPIGSELSRNYDMSAVRPQKLMTQEFISKVTAELVDDNTEVVLFCVNNEISMFEDCGVRIIAAPNIWDCIACVSKCDLVIAVDSAIKTVSAALHIPTIVLLGDYPDPQRDNKFILPYKEITPIRFKFIDMMIKPTITKARELLGG
jgi:ADP-heptose:LPS heptosyltransferase